MVEMCMTTCLNLVVFDENVEAFFTLRTLFNFYAVKLIRHCSPCSFGHKNTTFRKLQCNLQVLKSHYSSFRVLPTVALILQCWNMASLAHEVKCVSWCPKWKSVATAQRKFCMQVGNPHCKWWKLFSEAGCVFIAKDTVRGRGTWAKVNEIRVAFLAVQDVQRVKLL